MESGEKREGKEGGEVKDETQEAILSDFLLWSTLAMAPFLHYWVNLCMKFLLIFQVGRGWRRSRVSDPFYFQSQNW